MIVALVLEVKSVFLFCINFHDYSFQCIETRTRPKVTIPVLDNEPSVRPVIERPNKEAAIKAHESRMKK